MASLFISYSRKDSVFARKLTDCLKDQKLDFWIDWEGIAPSVDWRKQIEDGIEKAGIFIFLMSPDSARSEVCRWEIDHAVRNGKRLIPIVVRDISAAEAPPDLGKLHWILILESDNFDEAFAKLLTTIKTDYDWVQTHRDLQVKALEWERNNRNSGFLLHGEELRAAELQITANSSKEPNPTDLQRKFVAASRKATDRQRRTLIISLAVGILALSILSVIRILQADKATKAEATAGSNLAVAQTAQAEAISQKEEAEKQAKIALARPLVAQGQVIIATRNSKQMIADLLAVQSLKLLQSSEGARILLNDNDAGRQIARMTYDVSVTVVKVTKNAT